MNAFARYVKAEASEVTITLQHSHAKELLEDLDNLSPHLRSLYRHERPFTFRNSITPLRDALRRAV